ncbi:hypothetical protein PVAG01_03898 [Phlyctema vagabunda]|uniref:Uncharacterized protein n=1 Tax=Phlyctema vagabunda TaxID=108571 RepID=A0ABR4PMQ9_9HELO
MSTSTSLPPVHHNTTTLPAQSLQSYQQPKPTTKTYHNTKPTQEFLKMRHATQTTTARPSLMTRLRGRHANRRTVKTTTVHQPRTTAATTTTRRSGWGGRRANRTTAAPVHHQRRKVSIGDKISGAMLKLKGSLTHRPGVKAAGTRRMHGTDGRGSHRAY